MNIGIITFHWATNYGAVLQTFALQEALSALGHNVHIINYKPRKYDDTLYSFIRFRKFKNLSKYYVLKRKENKMKLFRANFLNETRRYHSLKELKNKCLEFEVLITGSDQVLNPSFLTKGELNGSTAYFLDFGKLATKKIAYGVSFGTTDYPKNLCKKVRHLIENFEKISVREDSGIEIIKMMNGKDAIVVCDPTLLHTKDFYDTIIEDDNIETEGIQGYLLHNRENFVSIINQKNIKLISDESISQWLVAIKKSSHLITNSFHGMMFCLIFNVPFSIVLPNKMNIGMNDRFYTLLSRLNLTNRIFSEIEFNEKDILNAEFNWNEINNSLENLRNLSWKFLKQI